MPGLLDWSDKFIPLVSCLVLYAVYFYRGRQRANEGEGEGEGLIVQEKLCIGHVFY